MISLNVYGCTGIEAGQLGAKVYWQVQGGFCLLLFLSGGEEMRMRIHMRPLLIKFQGQHNQLVPFYPHYAQTSASILQCIDGRLGILLRFPHLDPMPLCMKTSAVRLANNRLNTLSPHERASFNVRASLHGYQHASGQ